jgi:hypothetical protein
MSGSDVLSARGATTCRACDAVSLESVLDLGRQPLANELLPAADAPDAAFPLHLRICRACGLGQVEEVVLPERLFGDYPYLSSVSSSWVAHARTFAKSLQDELGLGEADTVVEIASNDGYLLREFQALGVQVLGVEPAENVADLARATGVPTVSTFFGRQAARDVVDAGYSTSLVVANNVLAHVPDLDDFVGGLAALCHDRTVVTVENPSFTTLLAETQFDTIYHEHYSYLSAHSVSRLVARHGLELVRVEDLPTHGGSYRYWIVPRGARPVEPSVDAAIARELAAGLLSEAAWTGFSERSRSAINGLRSWLDGCADRGERVAGYGAAAKGNTLMNAAGVVATDVVAVADGSAEKQGKYLPGSRVPVIAPESLPDVAADHVLILPWNIAAEIVPILGRLTPRSKYWRAVPTMGTFTR